MSTDKHAFSERVHVVVVYYGVSEILVDLRIFILFNFVNSVDNWAQVLILAEAQPFLGKKENMRGACNGRAVLAQLTSLCDWKKLVCFYKPYAFLCKIRPQWPKNEYLNKIIFTVVLQIMFVCKIYICIQCVCINGVHVHARVRMGMCMHVCVYTCVMHKHMTCVWCGWCVYWL